MRLWSLFLASSSLFLAICVSPCFPQQATVAESPDQTQAVARPQGTLVRPPGGVQHPDLDKAWADYDAAIMKVTEPIKAAIAKQINSATAKGDLDAAQKWLVAQEKFEKGGELPPAVETKATVTAAVVECKRAREGLAKVYEAVVKSLTIEKKIKEAQVIRDEYRGIETAAEKTVTQTPAAPASKSRENHPPRAPERRQSPGGLAANQQRALTGTTWKYHHAGGLFTLREGGQVVSRETGEVFATWKVLNSQVTVTQIKGKWVNAMVLSPDGIVLSGTTDRGAPVGATRIPVK